MENILKNSIDNSLYKEVAISSNEKNLTMIAHLGHPIRFSSCPYCLAY